MAVKLFINWYLQRSWNTFHKRRPYLLQRKALIFWLMLFAKCHHFLQQRQLPLTDPHDALCVPPHAPVNL